MKKEASYYEKGKKEQQVKCLLCPHMCVIDPGDTGICKVRKNIDGTLYSLNYCRISALALDPVEKKPLYDFYPGKKILSIGSVGCNFKCPFCQNHSIAHSHVDFDNTEYISAGQIVSKAMDFKEHGNIGIAYTYNEPTVWFETMVETSKQAKREQLKNVVVTNGYINPEPLEELIKYTDAFNIDLKSYDDRFYREIVKGGLEPVKETIRRVARRCHTEVTTLIIPGKNDSREQMRELAKFLARINPDITLHITRFFPNYKWTDIPPTDIKKLYELAFEAQKSLEKVHLGNV